MPPDTQGFRPGSQVSCWTQGVRALGLEAGRNWCCSSQSWGGGPACWGRLMSECLPPSCFPSCTGDPINFFFFYNCTLSLNLVLPLLTDVTIIVTMICFSFLSPFDLQEVGNRLSGSVGIAWDLSRSPRTHPRAAALEAFPLASTRGLCGGVWALETSVPDDLNCQQRGRGRPVGAWGCRDPDRGDLNIKRHFYCSHSSGSQKSEITGWRGGPLVFWEVLPAGLVGLTHGRPVGG